MIPASPAAKKLSRGWPQSGGGSLAAASEKLATLLDDAYRIPHTNIRFGWDTIIGLVPGVGDAATALAGLTPIAAAWKLGASRWTLGRMLLNLLIDSSIGAIPILGDTFDLFFKAHRRNVTILRGLQK